jgi:GntR family transcriptional regulator
MSNNEAKTVNKRNMVDRVRHEIVELIAERGLEAGDKLDTETALAKRFEVSRPTVREALKALEAAGLLNAIQGYGRFISSVGSLAVERPITRYEGITEVLVGLGYDVESSVLSVTEDHASPVEAQALKIDDGAPVIRLARIRSGDGKPLVVNLNTIVRDALPGPIAHRDWSTSLNAALQAHGHDIVSSVARITATELPQDLAHRHALTDLGPLLLIEETCLTRNGHRVLYAEDYHRGDAIAFNVLRHR